MERRCCYCQVEFNIPVNKGDRVSHGTCKRHYEQQMKEYNLEMDSIDISDDKFCPDMSQVFDG